MLHLNKPDSIVDIGHVDSVDLCGGIDSRIIKKFGKEAAELGKGFKYVSDSAQVYTCTPRKDLKKASYHWQGVLGDNTSFNIKSAFLICFPDIYKLFSSLMVVLTHQHDLLTFTLGVSQLIVAVNKMDMTKARCDNTSKAI
ncbi:hypothetical protein BDR06DRAFT_973947 [Suillus hirtellus]|nr:hypothetical protein BDR06DRAFT_973947 [Suillus hirtellus]